MKNMSMKIVVVLAVLAAGVSAAGASDLPDCPTDQNASWNNCIGTYTTSDGDKYVGEWEADSRNGQGTQTLNETR